MKPIKVLAIVFVIGAGIVGSYLTIKNSFSSLSLTGTGSLGADFINNPDIKKPLQLVENIFSGKSLEEIFKKLGGEESASTTDDNQNLTDLLSNPIASHLAKLFVQNGENLDIDKALNEDFNDKDFLENLTETFNGADRFFSRTITEKDLKISLDNSETAKEKYFDKITEAINQRFSPFSASRTEKIIDDFEAGCLVRNDVGRTEGFENNTEQAALTYGLLAGDLFETSVPSDLADFHKDLLEYYLRAKSVYFALAECGSDAVKGYLAFYALPQLTSEAQAIQKIFEEKISSI